MTGVSQSTERRFYLGMMVVVTATILVLLRTDLSVIADAVKEFKSVQVKLRLLVGGKLHRKMTIKNDILSTLRSP